MRIRPIALALVLGSPLGLGACQKPTPPGDRVQVTRVLNGQLMEVRLPDQSLRRVRLAGIQTPDPRQKPWGDRAFRELNALVKGDPAASFSVLWVAPPAQPRGAYQGYVWRGDLFLNEAMLQRGLGYHVPGGGMGGDHTYGDRLYQAQNQGRILGLGIWNPQEPLRQTPQEFRQTLPPQPAPLSPAKSPS